MENNVVLIVADIHASMSGLDRTLQLAERFEADKIVILGDTFGVDAKAMVEKLNKIAKKLVIVMMGLVVLVAFKPLMDAVSPHAVGWIIGEGACYVIGALFYSLNKRRYMHSVFHFFVLAGSVCHILAVWDILEDYI